MHLSLTFQHGKFAAVAIGSIHSDLTRIFSTCLTVAVRSYHAFLFSLLSFHAFILNFSAWKIRSRRNWLNTFRSDKDFFDLLDRGGQVLSCLSVFLVEFSCIYP